MMVDVIWSALQPAISQHFYSSQAGEQGWTFAKFLWDSKEPLHGVVRSSNWLGNRAPGASGSQEEHPDSH